MSVMTGCNVSSNLNSREQSYEISGMVTALSIDETAGDIRVSAGDGPIIVKEILRFNKRESTTSHRITGQTLHLEDNGCGSRSTCSVDYDVRVPAAVAVAVKASAGQVTVANMSENLDLSATAGTVKGTGLRSESTHVQTSAGTVHMTYVRAPRLVEASAETGNVSVRVPGDASYAVDADAQIGSRKIGVNTDPSSVYKIRVRASVGNVSVQPS